MGLTILSMLLAGLPIGFTLGGWYTQWYHRKRNRRIAKSGRNFLANSTTLPGDPEYREMIAWMCCDLEDT